MIRQFGFGFMFKISLFLFVSLLAECFGLIAPFVI